jgi:hypothetical protein
MKTQILIAIILIAIGVIAFAYEGITYMSREKIIDFGPLEVTAQEKETISLPPVLGGISLVGGIVLLIFSTRKK